MACLGRCETRATARRDLGAARREWLEVPAVRAMGSTGTTMNDDEPPVPLEDLKAEHRDLDAQIRILSSEPIGDQLELARLKRRKLMLKDQIQRMIDSNVPDIIA